MADSENRIRKWKFGFKLTVFTKPLRLYRTMTILIEQICNKFEQTAYLVL